MEATNGIENGNNRKRKAVDLFKPVSVRPDGERIESANWCVRFQHHGKRTCRSLGTADFRVAQQRAKELVKTVKARGWESATLIHGDPASVTITDLLEKYRTAAIGRGLKPLAIRSAVIGLQRIAKDTGATRLAQLTPDRIQAWIERNMASGSKLRPTTVKSKLRNAAAVFGRSSLAAMNMANVANPFKAVIRPKVTVESFAAPSREAIKKLMADGLAELTGEQRIVFALALGAGLRLNEACTLTWESVKPGGVEVKATFSKTRKARLIPISDAVRAALGEPGSGPLVKALYATHRGLCAWLRGRGITAINPVHWLRKCFGSLAVADHGIFLASKLLGHAKISMTAECYAGAVEQLPVVTF